MKKLITAAVVLTVSFGAHANDNEDSGWFQAGYVLGSIISLPLKVALQSQPTAEEQQQLQQQHEEFTRQHQQNHQDGMRNRQLNNCAHFSDNAAQCELEARRQWDREDQGSW